MIYMDKEKWIYKYPYKFKLGKKIIMRSKRMLSKSHYFNVSISYVAYLRSIQEGYRRHKWGEKKNNKYD